MANTKSSGCGCQTDRQGSNPNVVDQLRSKGAGCKVLQSDRLHAKVYLFSDAAVIGSSNASANGLALQGAELTHWDEANILVLNEDTLAEIRSWMDTLTTRRIEKDDIERAKEKWDKRRRDAAIPTDRSNTVLQALRNEPEQFKNKNAYLVIYFDDLSDEAYERQVALQEKYGSDQIGIFEDWEELPKEGVLLCFEATRRSFIWYNIWCRSGESLDHRLDENGNTVQIVRRANDVFGLEADGESTEWRNICRQVVSRVNGARSKEAIFVSLYKLIEWGIVSPAG